MAPLVPLATMVNRALSTVRPTANDSILAERRANTPATRLMRPASSATKTEMMCFSKPSSKGLCSVKVSELSSCTAPIFKYSCVCVCFGGVKQVGGRGWREGLELRWTSAMR